MPKKKDCPYCGKKEAGYNHITRCKAKVEATPLPEVGSEAEAVLIERLAIEKPPDNLERCRKCGEQTAIRLNKCDMRCSICGDYEIKKRILNKARG